jgi:hypothetical protein
MNPGTHGIEGNAAAPVLYMALGRANGRAFTRTTHWDASGGPVLEH